MHKLYGMQRKEFKLYTISYIAQPYRYHQTVIISTWRLMKDYRSAVLWILGPNLRLIQCVMKPPLFVIVLLQLHAVQDSKPLSVLSCQ